MTHHVALVTGAASGIGVSASSPVGLFENSIFAPRLACAKEFFETGCSVALCDIDETKGIQEAHNLNSVAKDGQKAAFFKADLSKPEDTRTLVSRTVSPVEDFPEDKWRFMMELMLNAPFVLTQTALPGMYKNGWGRIINIGSIHAHVASPYKSAYVTAKHGLLGLTKTVALEGAEKGVTCNMISPSYVRTPLVENQLQGQADLHNMSVEDVITKVMLAPAAIKKLLEPIEVAKFAAYLVSDYGSGITGSAHSIDCGWTAR
ncbi:hypothetical protein SmJEL517_g04367 [Synchytrium microbalum]|uniref:3-oxoacyl-[acyl-carrier-protein] reductase n=1 Tax=Synchytrium microbalum TaxID=1806994 RepID=A0A507BZJ0_9FUNG|nr:uncharacterized protein SmJEL517_g04367 [Synchytrium microbalum]TPX32528.1 hypothetical protein SmJEL517_g04367 [Synchytrium microbalum]